MKSTNEEINGPSFVAIRWKHLLHANELVSLILAMIDLVQYAHLHLTMNSGLGIETKKYSSPSRVWNAVFFFLFESTLASAMANAQAISSAVQSLSSEFLSRTRMCLRLRPSVNTPCFERL